MHLIKIKYKYFSGWREYFVTLRYYGYKGLLDYVKQRSLIKTLPRNLSQNENEKVSRIRTSITHVNSYLDICNYAAYNQKVLQNFRMYAEYQIILDHVSRRNGELCLNLFKEDKGVLANLQSISSLLPGNPIRFEYPSYGNLSPTDIRYAKIIKDLDCLFSFDSPPSICEIGIGFGGQAAQAIEFFKPSKYYLVDLPEVLVLTKAVLSKVRNKSEVIFLDPGNIDELKPDLVISNYAFSELTKPSQELYLRNIVLNSKRGYMLYNHIHEEKTDAYSAQDIVSLIPGSIILEENPLTFRNNVLIVWGLDKELDTSRFTVKLNAGNSLTSDPPTFH